MIWKILGTGAALWVAIWLVSGLEFDGDLTGFAVVTGLVLVANAIVKPLFKLLSLPIIILTLGLFSLVINALVLQLVVWLAGPSMMDLGFTSTGFFWATFLGALVISVVSTIVEKVTD